MTRREQLQEQYEDALFALLMDEVATAEGEKALEENERLKNDPDAVVPAEVRQKCLRSIRRRFAVKNARAVGRFTARAFSKVALVAGIAAMLFTVAFAASETVRTNTLNLVVEVFDDHTAFSFAGSDDGCRVVAGWLPEGYVLESQSEDSLGSDYLYRKSEDEYFSIFFTTGDGTVLGADTEDAEVRSIAINGTRATLVKKENEIQITWGIQERPAFLCILGTGITEEDLVHIAEKLNY